MIQVRSLFPVYLYGDKGFVHKPGNFRVLKGLLLHDMTPVTGGVPDGQKYGFILFGRLVEGLFAPGIPINRVVGVLEQIRAFL
jgi:hypothetical protein